jgi:tetratricopeptide (TPR) repeat protein
MYYRREAIIYSGGYYYDTEGNKIKHYVNFMKDGLLYAKTGNHEAATKCFLAALDINPGDDAALFELEKVK